MDGGCCLHCGGTTGQSGLLTRGGVTCASRRGGQVGCILDTLGRGGISNVLLAPVFNLIILVFIISGQEWTPFQVGSGRHVVALATCPGGTAASWCLGGAALAGSAW